MKPLVYIFVFLFLVLYSAIAYGVVVYNYWDWFLLPIFPAVTDISFSQAIGLAFFISLFKGGKLCDCKPDEEQQMKNLFITLLSPWVTLLIGWLVHAAIS